MGSPRRSSSSTSSNPVKSPESSDQEINIYLKVVKTVALHVNSSETIRNLKAKIRGKEGVSEYFQELFFNGEQLKDDYKLLDCGIQKNSTLHLVLQTSGVLKLYVSIPSKKKTIEVEAKIHDTIQYIQSVIQEKEGFHSDQYSLFYAGMPLETNRTLAFHGIKGEATLHLVFKPREVLSLAVRMPTGELVKAEVKVLYTVGDIKVIVSSKVGYPVGDENLVYEGKKLEDSKIISYYDIKEESVLDMVPPASVEIFIKTQSGEAITIFVAKQDKILDVKRKICHMLGKPVHPHCLEFSGNLLEDDQYLATYGIGEYCIIYMVYQIFVRTWSGETITLFVCQDDTIRDVKDKVCQKLGKVVPSPRLEFARKVLEDDHFLASYDIKEHDTLNMVLCPARSYFLVKLSAIGVSRSCLRGPKTVGHLKKMIQDKLKKPVKEVTLRGHEQVLRDQNLLANYAIKEDSVMVVHF